MQVTERAAGALNLKADATEVNELRLYFKGQLADMRGRMKEGQGRGRLMATTQEGQTICLSCDQPLANPRGQQAEASGAISSPGEHYICHPAVVFCMPKHCVTFELSPSKLLWAS